GERRATQVNGAASRTAAGQVGDAVVETIQVEHRAGGIAQGERTAAQRRGRGRAQGSAGDGGIAGRAVGPGQDERPFARLAELPAADDVAADLEHGGGVGHLDRAGAAGQREAAVDGDAAAHVAQGAVVEHQVRWRAAGRADAARLAAIGQAVHRNRRGVADRGGTGVGVVATAQVEDELVGPRAREAAAAADDAGEGAAAVDGQRAQSEVDVARAVEGGD